MPMPMIEIARREPFNGGPGASGAWFERGVLSDGRSVILKHLPAEGDWLTRATDGLGRARLLWESGVLEKVTAAVDHAVIDVLREDDHDVVLMEDVSAFLLPAGARLSHEQVDRLLAGLATLHASWEGCALNGLCSAEDRNALFVPAFHRADSGPHPHPRRDDIVGGWEVFADTAPDDIVQAIFAVHTDPSALGQQLRMAAPPPTLLHGDAKLDNLGLRGDRLVAVDWGDLTGTGPAEMDIVWFAALSTLAPNALNGRIAAMPDELFRMYGRHAPRGLNPRSLDLACIGMMAQGSPTVPSKRRGDSSWDRSPPYPTRASVSGPRSFATGGRHDSARHSRPGHPREPDPKPPDAGDGGFTDARGHQDRGGGAA
jgi:hypothetical protein